MSRSKKNVESAVSPVVGVMLMLVVTIIIAAVVSAFAGGLSTGSDKMPQMTITASFSNSTGMTITHNGGDTVNTLSTKFIVTPTADFGSYTNLHWTVNSSDILVSNNGRNAPWDDPTLPTSQDVRTFQPGEVALISVTNLSQVQPQTYTTDTSSPPTDAFNSNFGFMNPAALGQHFKLELVDSSGKIIAQTVVTIKP